MRYIKGMPDYAMRINRVLDYMESRLDRPLSLEELARVACFSPYHFHRIFFTHTGERPFEYLQRLRLEKAANLLVMQTGRSVIDIALECGFGNAPAFSRAFKARFGTTPTQWRTSSCENSNMGTAPGNSGQEPSPWIPYIEYNQGRQLWRMRKGNEERIVEVKPLEPLTLAYIRYTGPYKGDGALFHNLWTSLCTQAGARDLIGPDSRYIALYHDNPDLTEKGKLRVTMGVSTDCDFEPTGRLGRMELEGGKYAFARFRLNSSEYQEAWDWVYRHWLPRSGYLPGDKPSFELFPGEEESRDDGRYPVIICIPLVAAP